MDTTPASNPTPVNPPQSIYDKYKPLFFQLLRFGIVGGLNTGIDFAITNALSYVTGITGGSRIIPIKGIAFLAANVNSYLLNKKWTFNDHSSGEGAKKFSVYLSVSIIGALINISTVYLITTYTEPMFGLSDTKWLNVANLAATALSLVWNFVGYKLIVFRGK